MRTPSYMNDVLIIKYIYCPGVVYVVQRVERERRRVECVGLARHSNEKKRKTQFKFTPGFSNRRKMERGEMTRKYVQTRP